MKWLLCLLLVGLVLVESAPVTDERGQLVRLLNKLRSAKRQLNARNHEQERHQKKEIPAINDLMDNDNNAQDAEDDFEMAFHGQSGNGLATFLEFVPALLGENMEGIKDDWQNADGGSGPPVWGQQGWADNGDEGSGRPQFEDWFNDIDWKDIISGWIQSMNDQSSGSGLLDTDTGYGRPRADRNLQRAWERPEKPEKPPKNKPDYTEYWPDIDWKNIISGWIQSMNDQSSGSGLSDTDTGYGRPRADRNLRTTWERPEKPEKPSKNKPDYTEYWKDIDWAAVNSAIQEAFDKAKEVHKDSRSAWKSLANGEM